MGTAGNSFPLYPALRMKDLLRKELFTCSSVLDIGCGSNSPIQNMDVHYTLGVDSFKPYVEKSKIKGIHTEYMIADINKIEFKERSFDAVIALDFIEHLDKETGYQLIKKMQKWAIIKVILLTPNGHVWQDDYDNNESQKHQSGWSAEELRALGFRVCGMAGWKPLRGYRNTVKLRPALFGIAVSGLSQSITYYVPSLAFQLFAVRNS